MLTFINDRSNIISLSIYKNLSITLVIGYIITYIIILTIINHREEIKIGKNNYIIYKRILETVFLTFPNIIINIIILPGTNINILDNIYNSIPILLEGNQWYWNNINYKIIVYNYNISDYYFPYNSNNNIILKNLYNYKLYITSKDVIHALGIDNLSIKIDSIPGHISTYKFYNIIPGLYNGKCYEFCGILHSYMPLSFIIL